MIEAPNGLPQPMAAPRQAPHSVEAEQSLLGALMLDPKAVDRISGIVTEADFYRDTHRLIFRAILACGDECDPITVGDWIANRGEAERVENGAYLTALANNTPGASNASGYARVIREKADRRRVLELAIHAEDAALNGHDLDESLEILRAGLSELEVKGATGPRSIDQIAASWFDHLHSLADPEKRIDTGLADVDAILHGLLPGELMVLAGRPGTGKTSAALTVLEHVTKTRPGLIFSLEMSEYQLLKRLVAGHGVAGHKFRDTRQLTDRDWSMVMARTKQARKQKLLIDDTSGLAIAQMAARAREAKRRHGIALIVVDYLQLVTCRAPSRYDEVSMISRQLKGMAKQLQVPVIALSQLSRSVEQRADKRPQMYDLRESGQLEQDADIICLLYRNGVYDKADRTGIAEWIIAKHRDGEPSTAHVRWDGSRTRFLNADLEDVRSYQNELLPEPPSKQSKFATLDQRGAA